MKTLFVFNSSSESVALRRRRLKEKLIEYKGGECEICGYKKCYRALEFHHIDPSQKEFKKSSTNKAFETLKKEVDKCILVCSNCHMEIHEQIEVENRRKYDSIKDYNIKRYFSKNDKTQKRCKQRELDIDSIIEDIMNGLSQKEIADKYNVSVATIKRFISSHGVNMKKIQCNLST